MASDTKYGSKDTALADEEVRAGSGRFGCLIIFLRIRNDVQFFLTFMFPAAVAQIAVIHQKK